MNISSQCVGVMRCFGGLRGLVPQGLMLAWLLFMGSAWGAAPLDRGTLPEPNPPAETAELTQEEVDAGRKAAESDTSLSAALKPKVLELYDQAEKWLQEGATAKKELAALETQVKQAPKRVAEIRQRLAAPPTEKEQGAANPKLTLEQAELAVSEAELALSQRRDAHKQRQDDLDRLLVGSKGFNDEINSRTTALEQIDRDLRSPVSDEPKAMTQARLAALKARKALRQAELDQFKLKLGSVAVLTQLAQTERDLLAQEIAEDQPRLEALNKQAQELRERQARDARQEAQSMQATTGNLPPEIQAIGAETNSLHGELSEVSKQEVELKGRLDKVTRNLEQTKADFERTRQWVEALGASEAISKLLTRRRTDLLSMQSYRRALVAHAAEINKTAERMLDLDDEQRQQHLRREVLEQWRKDLLAKLPEAERERLLKEASALVQANQEVRNELQQLYGRYSGELAALETTGRQLAELSTMFRNYIDDQLLWAPSASIALVLDPEALRKVVLSYTDPELRKGISEDLANLATNRALPLLVLVLTAGILLWLRGRVQERLSAAAKQTRRVRTDAFRHTLHALGWTLVHVSPWPLLLIGGGLLVMGLPTAHATTLRIATGLVQAGAVLGSLTFLRLSCQPEGLGDDHLRWPEGIRAALVEEISWMIPVAVPLGFVMAVTAEASISGNAGPGPQLLSQISFAVYILIFSLLAYRLLSRGGPVMTGLRSPREGLVTQLHFLWFPAVVLVPVILAITSMLGYHYTAVRLEQRLELTFWFFVGLFLLKELVLRYLYVAERRLRYENALRRREEVRVREAAEDETPRISLDIPVLNFGELGDQAERLVHAGYLFAAVLGIWSIWSRLLPVLGFLKGAELPFTAQRVVEGVAKQVPVTLEDLVICLILLVITTLAARNLPGVLEITLLQRLPLDPGGRYAVKTLSQYSIAGIGVFSAFSAIGWQWSSIQWLVAALGVGLGFGLQEIVANFISGIILLFERPIRVGDVVSIAGTTGTVSRIRIRATTITNNDKQEFVVPNKLFITGQLVNWTLSDKLNRVAINLGVAYGSDVRRALDLMLEAALENDQVLKDPKPVATFEGFGESALNLVLRCFLGNMDNRGAVISALHQAVHEKFTAAGIDIPYPQRDLRLGIAAPVDVRILQEVVPHPL